ncbi:MAG: PEP-CTERM sorting domain-containing protein [Opitutaceae bacterium]|jgi:hypothetical protein|nr:PEP-CTERM sorting domain-containing protein [Opitutaceae bacterium]
MKTKPSSRPRTRPFPFASTANRLPVAAGLALLSVTPLQADTQYWNKTTPNLTWANSSNANWAATEDGTSYATWTSGNDAEIVTPDAQITLGGSAPLNVGNLTIRNGAFFTGTTGYSTTVNISGTGGRGDFTLQDIDGGGAKARIAFATTTAGDGYNGTITVNSFTDTYSGLVLGGNTKPASPPSTLGGTGVNTHVILNGGKIMLEAGLVGTAATLGSLSGSGVIALTNVYSSTGGTRTLRIDQTADTAFSGAVGATTITQSNNILALVKAGEGRLAITNTEASGSGYAGDTTVEGGKLYLAGTFGSTSSGGTNVNQGNFIVKATATLGLSGTFNTGGAKTVTIENGGTLDLSNGSTTIDGIGTTTSKGLVFSGNATLIASVGADGSTLTLADATMTGSAEGGDGSIRIKLANANAQVGETCDLIHFGGTTPGIAITAFVLAQESIDAGWAGTLAYGGDGNTLQFTISALPAAIPEPATTAALIAALAAVATILLRRRHIYN